MLSGCRAQQGRGGEGKMHKQMVGRRNAGGLVLRARLWEGLHTRTKGTHEAGPSGPRALAPGRQVRRCPREFLAQEGGT